MAAAPGGLNATPLPAAQIVSLMVDAQAQLLDTLSHYSRDDDQAMDMRPGEFAAHRQALAEQAAVLQGRLDRLVAAAEAMDGGEESEAEAAEHLKLTIDEVHRLRVAVRGVGSQRGLTAGGGMWVCPWPRGKGRSTQAKGLARRRLSKSRGGARGGGTVRMGRGWVGWRRRGRGYVAAGGKGGAFLPP